MSFLYPSIALLGLGLVLLPLVIHLISRRRRQRIEWAAMDFLLDSNKKNQSRSRLEEWFLLLLRILAIALVALIAAVPQFTERLGDWFEGDQATHIVLLDDSYSMAELDDSGSPWVNAKEAIDRLVNRSKSQGSPVRLIRYSDAITRQEPSLLFDPAKGVSRFDQRSINISELSVGPTVGLQRLQQLIDSEELSESRCYLTLLSDFQRLDHANNERFISALESVAEKLDGIVLAPCGETRNADVNLTVSELSIEPGPRTVGVETTGRIQVASYSESSVPKTTVEVFRDQSLLTTLEIGPFQANESLEVTFPLLIQKSGPQVIRAQLPSDSLLGDNERRLVLDLPKYREVLLVDGSEKGSEGRAFAAAFSPQASIQTGWKPRVIQATSLESFGDLSNTAVVCLLDIPRLGKQAKREIGTFVQRGGGLLNVLGPQADRSFYNQTIEAKPPGPSPFPLLPLKLDLPTQSVWPDSGEAMIEVRNHPALRVLSGQRNGFLPLVRIGMFQASKPLELAKVGLASEQKNSIETQTLINLSSGEPLLVEHRYGSGRIMTLLTTATPQQERLPWSNLATLPIFPVLVNEIGGWLAQEVTTPNKIILGEPTIRPAGAKSWKLAYRDESISWQSLRDETDGTAKPIVKTGAYRINSTSTVSTSSQQLLYFAANQNPEEGDLEKLSADELTRSFGAIAEVLPVDSLFLESDHQQSWRPTHLASMLLIAILIFERFLATRCSHINAVPSLTKGAV